MPSPTLGPVSLQQQSGDQVAIPLGVSSESKDYVICNGHSGQTTWVYGTLEPMATHLAAVHIGHYRLLNSSSQSVPHVVAAPDRLVP